MGESQGLVAQTVKNLPAMWETWVWSMGWEDPPWRRKWLPTPVFLPGEFHGQRCLAGYSLWGRKELDTTEWLTLLLKDVRFLHTQKLPNILSSNKIFINSYMDHLCGFEYTVLLRYQFSVYWSTDAVQALSKSCDVWFEELDKLILEFIWQSKESRIAKT